MRFFARGGLCRPSRAAAARGCLACALALLGSIALDATPGFWQAATQADFLRGEVEQLSIDEHGRLMLGPQVQRVADPSVPFVWALLPTRDGGYFLGTGNDGRVLRVDKGGTSSVFFDSSEMEVHALAPAPDGGVYVGTSPDGQVYKVDARGQATPFFDPDDKYIWALAVDAKGILYAATGDKGEVYRITPDGKGEAFFSTKTTHATSLVVDRTGHLIVGTGSPGRVFRVDASGKGFLLLDTPYQEIKSLRLDEKGVLYVAAQSGRAAAGEPSDPSPASEATRPPAVPSVSTEITAFAIIDVPVTSQPATTTPPADRRGPTGALYRVLPNGLWDQVWESRDDAPYDVAFEADGTLLVATGGRGKIFRLAGDPLRPTLLTRVSAQQATMLHRTDGRTYVATANPGLLLALSAGRAERGTYESEVRDARMVATWGTLSWRASLAPGTRIELSTRSGNTRTPDEAWSDWSAAYTEANGSAISSPNARYLQWRAVLTGTGDTPILTSVTAAFQQRNVRPEVESITVHPPGVVFQKPFSTGEAEIAGFDDDTIERRMSASNNTPGGSSTAAPPALGRRTYQKGLQTFVWKAEDANGDELTYDVLYRREGETTWKLLKSALSESILVWDTGSVPNGSYVLKVVASDAKSNPAETALRGERESASFEIDNTPPVVSLGTPRRDGDAIVVPFEIRDADSPLARVEYSLDAQRWQNAFPQDGILDSRHEQFALRLDGAAAGRTLVVRATDTMNNVGSGQVVVK
jgi:sugar lactone lactonase YvrE